MSTNENTNTDDVTFDDGSAESLDNFAAELFGDSNAAPDNAKSEDVSSDDAGLIDASDNDTDVTEEDDDTHSDDTVDGDVSEDDDTLAQDEDDGTKAKPKKTRFQERIDELTAKAKEAERDRDAVLKRFEELEAKLTGKEDATKVSDPQNSKDRPTGGPDKNAKKEDGTPKYPLGEYDPQFMRDTMQHMLDEREREQVQRVQQTDEERRIEEARNELQTEWNVKLVTAQERYPDFQEAGKSLVDTFSDIDPQYGEYLTTTIQELDNGTDVFYYLATNVDEAQDIVSAGAKKATMALARLDAKFGTSSKGNRKMRPTEARNPPPVNKGSAVAGPSVKPDTDDLDAFSRELFKKK